VKLNLENFKSYPNKFKEKLMSWEYKTEEQMSYSFSIDLERNILSSAGNDGWELIQIRDGVYDLQPRVIYTFKRRK
jgi:hypothetical protein